MVEAKDKSVEILTDFDLSEHLVYQERTVCHPYHVIFH